MPQPHAIPPWGKIEHDAAGVVVWEQSLVDHCSDVAAIFQALIEVPGMRRRLAALSGQADLDPTTVARLCYLVFLHDIGKVNAGFQARRDTKAPRTGHIAPLVALFGDRPDHALAASASDALDIDRFGNWGDDWVELFHAILSHHGTPWNRTAPAHAHVRHWVNDARGYSPTGALSAMRGAADAAFPEAFTAGAAPLAAPARFVHAVAGLAQLADWVASSCAHSAPLPTDRSQWATEQLRRIGFDSNLLRDNGTPPSFADVFGRQPYAHQVATAAQPGQLAILEAETGSGKTEAALWRFLTLFALGEVEGLYFALPTRTSAVQLHARITQMAERMWGPNAPDVVLAVPGYLTTPEPAAAQDDRGSLGGASVLPGVPDEVDTGRIGRRGPDTAWAAAHPARFFTATISVGTIDQAIMAAIRMKHACLRGATMMRLLLVIDEVHASDSYMQRYVEQLLRDHIAAGGHALLLSATLGAEVRQALMAAAAGNRTRDLPAMSLDEARVVPYPLLSAACPTTPAQPIASAGTQKNVAIAVREWLDMPSDVAATALHAARAGAKVLIIRNTVSGATATLRALEAAASPTDIALLFSVGGVPTLHHSMFAREDRILLDHAVEKAFGRSRPDGGCILVGTQTLEQSLDLDADLLVCDLCPMDVLLQRIGRLHRHQGRLRPAGFADPRAIVLTPVGGLYPFLAERRPGGLARHGLGHRLEQKVPVGVYLDVGVLEATRRLIVERPCWSIPRMNRDLVERAIHSEAIVSLIATLPDDERGAWQTHHSRVASSDDAKERQASQHVLSRAHGLHHEANVGFAPRVPTRLGLGDRTVTLPAATTGPFGLPVRQLSLPEWMARGIPEEPQEPTVHVTGSADALLVSVGPVRIIYSRHGVELAGAVTPDRRASTAKRVPSPDVQRVTTVG